MSGGERSANRAAPARIRISPVRRANSLLIVIVLHALVLSALLRVSGKLPGSPVGALKIFSLAPPSNVAPVPLVAAPPEKPRPRKKDGERNAPDIAPAAAQAATRGELCEPLEAINGVANADEAVRAALDGLPPPSIGLANTISVWVAGWNELAQTPFAPLAPLRSAIEATLATLPPACLESPVSGPRLVIVATAQRTNVLVFGSGQWRWAELIAEPLDQTIPGQDAAWPALFEKIFDEL